jgi:Icc-related predicted phosphoesterase
MSLLRGRRKGSPTLSLFFATDLHGSEKCFSKFLRAAEFYSVDALVLGGDLSGKIVVPLIAEPDGRYTTRILDRDFTFTAEPEVVEAEQRIRLNGFYPFRCTREELDELHSDDERRGERVLEVVREDVERWMAKADHLLAASGIPCVAIPGNDDDVFVGELLEQSTQIVNCEERVVQVDGFQVLGFGYSNPTPWASPRELSEEDITDRLDRAAQALDADRPTIFNVHVPPHNSGLDFAPELRPDRGMVGGGRTVPVGSTSVVAAIERYRPVLALHGHVHESRGAFRLGNSLCLNPGSEYNTGRLRGVIVRLAPDGVVGHQFVTA